MNSEVPPPKKSASLRRFLTYVHPYRGLITLAIGAGIIRYLIPLILPWTLKIIVDDFLKMPGAEANQFHFFMMWLCVLYFIYAIVSYYRSYLAGLAGHQIIFDLREQLYLHVQRMSLSFFDRHKIGAVVARMTSDIAAAQNFVGSALVNTAMDLACVVAIIALIFMAHWKLALVAVSLLPIYAISNFFLTKRIKAKSRMIHDQLQEISGDLHEQFGAISTIQAFTREEAEAVEFREQSERYLFTVLSNVKLQAIALGITGFLTAIGPILVLWFGVVEVWNGSISPGTLMAFYAYLSMLYQPIQRLTELNLILINSLAAMDRVFEVFDTYPEVMEKSNSVKLKKSAGKLSFDHVNFKYEGRPSVINDFTLEIPSGSTIALVGPSGSGKSTLVKLIVRFYDVTAGNIRLDDVDIRDISIKSLREQIAFVAQDPILLSGTVIENLRYGKTNATMDEITRASKAAFAHSFIERLPNGYETEIGERGIRLSGGQKQRLAIARAFLKDAPVLLLDEPTSALDRESEELIKEALKRLLGGRTAIIIAHRLSTVQHADKVVVIENGTILEQGKHEELLKLENGLYRRYSQNQIANGLAS